MSTLQIAGFSLEFNPDQLRNSAGEVVPLRPKSLSVLSYLGRRPNRTILKEELWQAVWPDVSVTDDSLVQCVREIRNALNDDGREFVRTEHKRGYRLVVPGVLPDFDEEAADFSQHIEFTRSADGTVLAYASAGTGAPLVRPQHWMTHLELDWQDGISGIRVRALAEQLRLVRFDARGTGLSQRNVSPGTLDDWVDDLAAVIDASGLEKCALFGVSAGAAVSVRYAVRNPDRVSCIVLSGPSIRGELHRGVSRENVEATCRVIEDGWGRPDGAFQRLVTDMLYPDADPAMRDTFCRLQLASCTGEEAARLIMEIQNTNAQADLAKVSVPTLVLQCTGDSAAPFEEGKLVAQSIPGARFVPIESNNHMPLPNEPAFATYINQIVSFVRHHAKR